MTLDVEHLTITIGGRPVVDDVSFSVAAGERFGIIGESGSGKSLTTLAILGLLPDVATATGSIRLDGTEILGRAERDLAKLRGDRIGAVFQDPQTALNPVRTVGRQLVEPLILHGRLSRPRAVRREAAVALATQVRLPDPPRIVDRYPHQLSGGQRQRVGIGMALACRPGLVLADEPTTALDVTIQAEILTLFRDLVDEVGASLVFVTHDLAVLAQITDRVLVLAGGRAIETGATSEVLRAPEHAATRGLVRAAAATGWDPDGVGA